MKTFKQQVGQLICPYGFGWCECGTGSRCGVCKLDAILAAHNAELERIAKEMPESEPDNDDRYYSGQDSMRSECQAYIQAQKGS